MFIADFHIHSHYSLATSKLLTPEYLDYWAKLKGITVIGTGDFSHPGWVKELKNKIEPAEQGLYILKPGYQLGNKIAPNAEVRFMLTAEISCIYKKYGKVRKVHNLIFAPDFETVDKIQDELQKRKFSITSDGRPIIGMDSKGLLDLCLNVNSNILFVPAHIWTPWFSVLGSKSGFDSVEECFEDLSDQIYAVETGLSSDSPLNGMCSFLDKYRLIANSDAHSPEKLGRNANIFNTELNYNSIVNAIKTGNPDAFCGTVHLYPQEGKYHYDGHRKCHICWSPLESLTHNGKCTKCGKPVIEGVLSRIVKLSDRPDYTEYANRIPYFHFIPLREILSEIARVSPSTGKIDKIYYSILQKTGNEFNVLLHLPVEEVEKAAGSIVAEAIRRMRIGEVTIQEGYDGEYGKIKVFTDNEINHFRTNKDIFEINNHQFAQNHSKCKPINFDLKEYKDLHKNMVIKNLKNHPDQQLNLFSSIP